MCSTEHASILMGQDVSTTGNAPRGSANRGSVLSATGLALEFDPNQLFADCRLLADPNVCRT